jgi:hypothetical protein
MVLENASVSGVVIKHEFGIRHATPQLLQAENVEPMHAHDYIMALEIRGIVTLNTNDMEQLTLLFATKSRLCRR